MKKALSLFFVISMLCLTVGTAEIKLDYDLMTETDLLQIMDEISARLENYGYTVAVQKNEETKATGTDSKQTVEMAGQAENVLYEYPISIRYIKVTNDKGLSTRKDCTVSFKNTSEKEIKRVYFFGTCYNRVDERCGGVAMSCTGPFKAEGGYSTFYNADQWKDQAASYIVLTQIEIIYMDDTNLVIDNTDAIERLFVQDD